MCENGHWNSAPLLAARKGVDVINHLTDPKALRSV